MMDSSGQAVNDELLSAYLDAALEDAEALAVERAIESDPELARRMACMLRNDRMLRRHYHAAALRPVPDSIADLLEPEPTRSPPERLIARLSDWLRMPAPLAVASAVAGVAAVGVGLLLAIDHAGPASDSRPDSVMAQALPSTNPEVAGFLERQSSGQAVALGEGASGVIDMSFEHADGRYCRQYRVGIADGDAAVAGVACRSDGSWREVLVQRVDMPVADSGMYQAAGGQAASAVDRYIVDNMVGDVVIGEEESRLIQGDWERP